MASSSKSGKGGAQAAGQGAADAPMSAEPMSAGMSAVDARLDMALALSAMMREDEGKQLAAALREVAKVAADMEARLEGVSDDALAGYANGSASRLEGLVASMRQMAARMDASKAVDAALRGLRR